MEIFDKNLTLESPEGYRPRDVTAQGEYLRLEYWQPVYRPGTTVIIGHNKVTIYLNSMGREVMRTTVRDLMPTPEVVNSITRRNRFRNGFFMILIGLEEMVRCLKS